MRGANDTDEIRLGQPVGRERSHHLEHPISAWRRRRGDEGRVDQAAQQQRYRLVDDLDTDCFRCVQVELAVEHAQRCEQHTGRLAEQIDGPRHDVAQRGVAAVVTIDRCQ